MGWRRVAEQEWALLAPATRDALTAYADGVNAYLAERIAVGSSRRSTPCSGSTGLDYTPEEWEPVDSLAWLKAMAWDLRGNMDDEIDRVLLSRRPHRGRDRRALPDYPYDEHPPIVVRGAVVDGVFEQNATGNGTRNPRRPAYPPGVVEALERVQDARRRDARRCSARGRGIGSNSWVVAGEHTATGKPLLANDPHLGISLPGIWYQMGLHCREVSRRLPFDVAGFTFSGVPGVVIGHNADIAWGFTNLGPDVTDLYLEQVEGDDRYVCDGEHDARWRSAPRRSRSRRRRRRAARSARPTHGPLISDVVVGVRDGRCQRADRRAAATAGNGYAVALAWTALDPAPTADAILELNRASDWDEFRAPPPTSRCPRRTSSTPTARATSATRRRADPDPARRATTARAGRGLDQRQRLDRRLHPVRRAAERARPGGRLHRHRQPGGHRRGLPLLPHRRLGLRLPLAADPRRCSTAEGELSVADMSRPPARHDATRCAETLVPYLLDVDACRRGYYAQRPATCCSDWDFTTPADSAPAAYFNAVWRNLLELTFHDDLRERTLARRRRPLVRGGQPACSTEPAGPVVGRRRHRRRRRDPRRHPAPGDDRGARRAHPAPGRATRAAGRGATCTG